MRGRSPSTRPAVLALVAAAALSILVLAVALGAGSYPSTLSSGARNFETAIGPGGAGLRFQVIQRQTEDARPGGPLVPVLDAADPSVVIGATDHLYVNSVLARGAITPGAFWMEMRFGPTTESAVADFDTSPFLWAVIYQPPNLWRNDGVGWYETDVSPGVGMDPVTAVKLPQALRNLKTITDLGLTTLNGISVRHFSASVDVVNLPGVIASDGASFTETPFPIDLWLDSSNRLVQLQARTRNLNEPDFLLKIDTVVTFTWASPGIVPDPLPTMAPGAQPQP
jgi:hypothetical protein